MKNYFIMHGTGASPYSNWFGWLFNKLNKDNEKCIVPQFPINEDQNYKSWKKILQGYHDAGRRHNIYMSFTILCFCYKVYC